MGSGASAEQKDWLNGASEDDVLKAMQELSADNRDKVSAALKVSWREMSPKTKAAVDAAWANLEKMIKDNPRLLEEHDALATPPPLVVECEAVLCKLCELDGTDHEAAKTLWKAETASEMGTALLEKLKKVQGVAQVAQVADVDSDEGVQVIMNALEPFASSGKCEKLSASSMLFGGIGSWLEAVFVHVQ